MLFILPTSEGWKPESSYLHMCRTCRVISCLIIIIIIKNNFIFALGSKDHYYQFCMSVKAHMDVVLQFAWSEVVHSVLINWLDLGEVIL